MPAVDLFTCGDDVNPWNRLITLRKLRKLLHTSAIKEMRRGFLVDQLERIGIRLKSTMRSERKDRPNPGNMTRNVWFHR